MTSRNASRTNWRHWMMYLFDCVVILFFLCSSFVFSYDVGKMYCYDALCKVPFSEGYAQHSYLPSKDGYLNLKNNARVSIHGRANISNGLVYYIKFNSKFGWVPSTVIRETKSMHKDLKFSFEYQDVLNVTYLQLQKKTILKAQKSSLALNFKDILKSFDTCHYNGRNTVSYNIEPSLTSTHEVIDGTTLPVDFIASTSRPNEADIKPTETIKPASHLNTGIPEQSHSYSVFDVDAKEILEDDNENDDVAAENEDEIDAENKLPLKIYTSESVTVEESVKLSNSEAGTEINPVLEAISSTIPNPLSLLIPSVTASVSNASPLDSSISSSGDSFVVEKEEQSNTMVHSIASGIHTSMEGISTKPVDELSMESSVVASFLIHSESISYVDKKTEPVSLEMILNTQDDGHPKESSVIASSKFHSESLLFIHEGIKSASIKLASSVPDNDVPKESSVIASFGSHLESVSIFSSFSAGESNIPTSKTPLSVENSESSLVAEQESFSKGDASKVFYSDLTDNYHYSVFETSESIADQETVTSLSTHNLGYTQVSEANSDHQYNTSDPETINSDGDSSIKTLPETYMSGENLEDKSSLLKEEKTDQMTIDVEHSGIYGEYSHDFILAMIPSFLYDVIHDKELGVSLPAAILLIIIGTFCIVLLSVYYLLQQLSREGKLKNMIAVLDRELYQLKTAVDLNLPLETLTAGVSNDQQESLKKLSDDLESEKKLNKTLQDNVAMKDSNIEELTKKCETLNEQLKQKGSEISPLAHSLIEEVRGELTMRDEINEKLEAKILKLASEVDSQKSLIENLKAEKEGIDKTYAELIQTNICMTEEKLALEAKVADHMSKVEELEQNVTELEQETVKKTTQLSFLETTIKSSENDNGVVSVDFLDKVNRLSDLEVELHALKGQKTNLLQQLESDKCKIVELEDAKNSLMEKAVNEKRLYKTLLKEKLDLTTRLEVLTNYYKNKENVLLKELNEFKERSDSSISSTQHYSESITAMELELNTYKSKMESMNSELESQERSYKSLLSQQEKKAHDNWLTARQAERKLDEMKQELSQLRGKLTQVEQERLSLISEKAGRPHPPDGGLMKSMSHRTNSEGDLRQDKDSQMSQFSMPRLDSPPLSLPPFPLLPPPGMLPPDMDGHFPGMLPPDFDRRHSPPMMPHPHHPPPPPHLFDIRPTPLGRRSPPPPPYYGDSYPHSMMDDNRSESGRSRTRGGGSPSSVRSNYSNHRMTPDFDSHSSNKNFNPYNAMPRGPADDMHAHPFPPPTKNRMNYVNDYDRDEYYRNGVAPSPPISRDRRAHEEI